MNIRNKNLVARKLLNWFENYGRKYPWRGTKDPYRIFVAETLLQKTNVEKVLPAYQALIRKCPSVKSLSEANLNELKKIVAPLGLIKRAGFLKRGAKEVLCNFNSKFPKNKKELKEIIGVGDYLAHAIMTFCFGQKVPLVDTNVARVYGRIYNFKISGFPYADKKLWVFSDKMLPLERFQEYNLALLDLSALVCLPRKPLCHKCPCSNYCFYFKHSLSNS